MVHHTTNIELEIILSHKLSGISSCSKRKEHLIIHDIMGKSNIILLVDTDGY